LRYLYDCFPDEIPTAKSMDSLMRKVPKPADHRIYVSRENNAVFGESMSGGVLTQNCHASLLENGIAIPEWAKTATEKDIIIGRLGVWHGMRTRLGRLFGTRKAG